MAASFSDYTARSHRASLVGGPKTYDAILVAGGMLVSAAAIKLLPRLASWATPKVEKVVDSAMTLMDSTKRDQGTSVAEAEAMTVPYIVEASSDDDAEAKGAEGEA